MMGKQGGTVLIVDDVRENVQMLGELLEGEGYEVCIAESGEKALEILAATPVDLVLLDIMMPGIDGYEVCRRIKASPATMDLPVIFLTALGSEADEAKGLAAGAVDYVSKPFKAELVRARVDTHVSLHRARTRLERLVEERTLQLAEAHRQLGNVDAARRELLGLVYKELWRPKEGLVAIAEEAIGRIPSGEPWKEHLGTAFLRARDSVTKLVNEGFFLGKGEVPGKSGGKAFLPVDLGQVVDHVVRGAAEEYAGLSLSLLWSRPEDGPLVAANIDLMGQVGDTMLKTAAALAAPQAAVSVDCLSLDGEAGIEVGFAPGFAPPEDIDGLFDPERAVWRHSPALSLGPAITLAARVATALGGRIATEFREGGKLSIRASFPAWERRKGAAISL